METEYIRTDLIPMAISNLSLAIIIYWSNFPNLVSKSIQDYIGFSLLRSVIDLESSLLSLDQSNTKLGHLRFSAL